MLVEVKVFPKSGRSKVEGLRDGVLVVRLKSAPEKGKANEELVRVLAGYYGVSRGQVEIKSGKSGRRKLVQVSGCQTGSTEDNR